MTEEMFELFVAIAMHAAIIRTSRGKDETVEDIAILAVKQAEAVERILKRTKKVKRDE
jgi:hypothetical protein